MKNMEANDILSKLKPILIILVIFSLVFFLRAEAADIGGVPDNYQSYYQEDSGLPYFSEMDSYYNYRLTSNFLDHGYLGIPLKMALIGIYIPYSPWKECRISSLIVWITAFFYYLANLFGDYSLLEVSFWTPAIIASLSVIPAYLFVRKISNDYGGSLPEYWWVLPHFISPTPLLVSLTPTCST